VYVWAVACLGVCAIAHSGYVLYSAPIGWNWFVLAILTLVSGSATVKLPSVPATISISETFVFTSVLLFGPAAGTLTVALDALVISLWLARKGHPFYRLAFNICALPASLWVGAHVFFNVWGGQPLSNSKPVEIGGLLAPLILFTVTYFLLNSWLIAFAISFEKHLSPLGVWKNNFARLSLNYFGGASVAALLVTYTRNIDLAYLAFVLPLLAVLYFTFSTSLGRVEDANKHLSELNSLYMSTIETLAMAIDAKDQITHGHIRRVQQYATGLAHAIGVRDPAQIKAIEAASLLHDMGKLAVPEYILNKPGSLTPAEFEKMKVHASVGADILSAIDFPYPVVPIVRHHHESWDGNGYPDGLAGSQIPIGARILSVVDCFDALTSDRPYRPRLSDAEAIEILMDRRGRMYDPLIVDAFVQVHRQIAPPEADRRDSSPHTLSVWKSAVGSTETVTSDTRLDDISASTEETLALYQLAHALSGELQLDDVARVILTHTRRLVPASTGVLFAYDEDSDELLCSHALGEHATQFQGVRIPRGQRLSGWVAASERTIVNSDPVLDLGEVARTMRPRLRSCLSTPLMGSSGLAGVLTLYSTQQEAFDENHRRIIEAIARQVAETVRRAIRAIQADSSGCDEQLIGLPNRHQLQRFIQAELGGARNNVALSLVFLSIRSGGVPGPKALRPSMRVLDVIRRNLRDGDVLFRYSSSELVVLLSDTDSTAATNVVASISSEILGSLSTKDKNSDVATVSIGTASAPSDGTTAESLVTVARTRQHRSLDSSQRRNSVH
jgi:diguanylate cyclase (GGDEF)-like protein/putative nucleotidyltransferase with HDIG domain